MEMESWLTPEYDVQHGEEGGEEAEVQVRVIEVHTGLALFATELRPINLPLMTFCQQLDYALHGGLDMGTITKLYGDKGIGKTTFCVQLCLNIQIPESMEGHGAESIFINTESSFCKKRLRVMARRFASHCRKASSDFTLSVKDLLNNIHVVDCDDASELKITLQGLHEFLKTRKVKLIVLDSLAFVFYECESNFEERVKQMYAICQELYSLASKYDLVVVVTNNMTTRFHENGRKYFIPYLGESWTFLPQNRLEMTRFGKLRKVRVAKSPKGYTNAAYYKVTMNGIRD